MYDNGFDVPPEMFEQVYAGFVEGVVSTRFVVWVCKEETAPSAITGMGVQFLELEASEAIGSVVDRLCAEAIPPADPSRLLLPPSR